MAACAAVTGEMSLLRVRWMNSSHYSGSLSKKFPTRTSSRGVADSVRFAALRHFGGAASSTILYYKKTSIHFLAQETLNVNRHCSASTLLKGLQHELRLGSDHETAGKRAGRRKLILRLKRQPTGGVARPLANQSLSTDSKGMSRSRYRASRRGNRLNPQRVVRGCTVLLCCVTKITSLACGLGPSRSSFWRVNPRQCFLLSRQSDDL